MFKYVSSMHTHSKSDDITLWLMSEKLGKILRCDLNSDIYNSLMIS